MLQLAWLSSPSLVKPLPAVTALVDIIFVLGQSLHKVVWCRVLSHQAIKEWRAAPVHVGGGAVLMRMTVDARRCHGRPFQLETRGWAEGAACCAGNRPSRVH